MTLDLGYAQLESISRAVEMQNIEGRKGEREPIRERELSRAYKELIYSIDRAIYPLSILDLN